MKTPAEAVRTWAFVVGKTVVRLGPVVAIGPFSRERGWARHKRWAIEVLERLAIDVHVDDRRREDALPASAATNESGALFVHLNQQTLLSQLLYSVSLPPCPLVVNVEYAALPFLGWASLALGSVPIVRQRPAQAKAALARVRARLVRGEAFGISIEGQRSRGGGLSPFKKGPVVLAIEAQCDIIPFMTHGEYELWPRGAWRIRPGRVDVVIYPRISTRGLRYEDRDRLVAELRSLAELENELFAAQKRPFHSGNSR